MQVRLARVIQAIHFDLVARQRVEGDVQLEIVAISEGMVNSVVLVRLAPLKIADLPYRQVRRKPAETSTKT